MRKRKPKDNIPALVMLSAGAIYCVCAFLYKIQGMTFLTQLLCVLLVFYVIGIIVLVIVEIKMPEHPKGEAVVDPTVESSDEQDAKISPEDPESSEENGEKAHQQEEETIYM